MALEHSWKYRANSGEQAARGMVGVWRWGGETFPRKDVLAVVTNAFHLALSMIIHKLVSLDLLASSGRKAMKSPSDRLLIPWPIASKDPTQPQSRIASSQIVFIPTDCVACQLRYPVFSQHSRKQFMFVNNRPGLGNVRHLDEGVVLTSI